MKSILKENIPNELYQTPVILYGGGITCKRILKLLTPYEIHIKYIVDDDMNKWGTHIAGIEIISYKRFREICKLLNTVSVILTSIYGKIILEKLNRIVGIKVYEMYEWVDKEYSLSSIFEELEDKNKALEFKNQINKKEIC